MFWVGFFHPYSVLLRFHRNFLAFAWSCCFCSCVYFFKWNCFQLSPKNNLNFFWFFLLLYYFRPHPNPVTQVLYSYRAIMCTYLKHVSCLQDPQVNSRAFRSEHSLLFLEITASFFSDIWSKNIWQSSQCFPLLSRSFKQIVQFRTPVILTLNDGEGSMGFIWMFWLLGAHYWYTSFTTCTWMFNFDQEKGLSGKGLNELRVQDVPQ